MATVTELRVDAIATDTTVESVSQAISARHVAASISSPYKSDHKTGKPSFCGRALNEQHVFLQLLFQDICLAG